MSFYQFYTYKSGDAIGDAEEFGNIGQSTVIVKGTGDEYVCATAGIFNKVSKIIPSRTEMDAIYTRLAADNTQTGDIIPSVTDTYDLGSETYKWADVWATTLNGTATSALYADLAEKYESDYNYEIGTVVEVGGSKEITLYNGGALAGVISELPGFRLNEEGEGQFVALKGKVPVKCKGIVTKGQYCLAVDGGKVIGVDKDDINDAELLDIVGVALDDSEDNTVMVKV